MIFYFTGTGNSLHCAKVISDTQNEKLISIASEFDILNNKKANEFEYTLKDGELLGFVYPIYAWGPARIVIDFIEKLKINGGKPFVFSVSTCGSEEGQSTKTLKKALAKKGIMLNSAFSVVMPNNYVVGSNVYKKDKETKILGVAELELMEINEALTKRQDGVFKLKRGALPGLKTTMANTVFNNFGRTTEKFFADDNCTSCGLCERICPIHTIKVEGKPYWGKDCLQCLACINRCPEHAIQFGKSTASRGRYVHPDLANSDKTP
ncbi:MAG: EFR1 family ferrodoxin [Clostridia bacterium]